MPTRLSAAQASSLLIFAALDCWCRPLEGHSNAKTDGQDFRSAAGTTRTTGAASTSWRGSQRRTARSPATNEACAGNPTGRAVTGSRRRRARGSIYSAGFLPVGSPRGPKRRQTCRRRVSRTARPRRGAASKAPFGSGRAGIETSRPRRRRAAARGPAAAASTRRATSTTRLVGTPGRRRPRSATAPAGRRVARRRSKSPRAIDETRARAHSRRRSFAAPEPRAALANIL